MTALDTLTTSQAPIVVDLISMRHAPAPVTVETMWDNRPTWDNWPKTPSPFDNRPTWDNWNKKK